MIVKKKQCNCGSVLPSTVGHNSPRFSNAKGERLLLNRQSICKNRYLRTSHKCYVIVAGNVPVWWYFSGDFRWSRWFVHENRRHRLCGRIRTAANRRERSSRNVPYASKRVEILSGRRNTDLGAFELRRILRRIRGPRARARVCVGARGRRWYVPCDFARKRPIRRYGRALICRARSAGVPKAAAAAELTRAYINIKQIDSNGRDGPRVVRPADEILIRPAAARVILARSRPLLPTDARSRAPFPRDRRPAANAPAPPVHGRTAPVPIHHMPADKPFARPQSSSAGRPPVNVPDRPANATATAAAARRRIHASPPQHLTSRR